MNLIDKKYFLHNTIFVGNRKNLESQLELEVKNFFEDPFGENKNTIFYKLSSLQVRIDEIRSLKNFINQSFDGVKIVIISSFVWGDEVQNALLKILEDTPSNTYIYLISQNKYSILPTILSRVFILKYKNISNSQKTKNNNLEIVKEILSLENNQRLESKNLKKILNAKVKIVRFIDNDDEEEVLRKDLELQLEFLEDLFAVFLDYFENLSEEKKKDNLKYIKHFQEIENLTKVEGAQLNYLIEFLILSLPKID